MTNQELFDTVVAHARKQNARALFSESCKYRTPEGLKCFAGALVKDEFYNPRFEGSGVQFKTVGDALVASGVARAQLALVLELQKIHDRYLVPEWPREFAALAEKAGLVYDQSRTV